MGSYNYNYSELYSYSQSELGNYRLCTLKPTDPLVICYIAIENGHL